MTHNFFNFKKGTLAREVREKRHCNHTNWLRGTKEFFVCHKIQHNPFWVSTFTCRFF